MRPVATTLYISKQQIGVRHLFKEVWDRELIFAVSYLRRMTSMIASAYLPPFSGTTFM